MSQLGRTIGGASAARVRPAWPLVLALAVAVYAVLQLGALGHPLFWQDEGETAMFGRRILEHGYPKVHGAEGVVYGMGVPLEVAVDAGSDAYLGSLWGQYYLAALGVAWADGIDDVHGRTWRVRLPFALAGITGLLALWLAFRRELAAQAGTAWPAAAGYAALLCLATSMQLHLREARYYGPSVGGVGLAVWLDRRLSRGEPGRPWAVAGAQAVVLIALLNVFYPAAVAVMGWILLESALAACRARSRHGSLPAGLALRVAPVVVAGAAAGGLAAWFDVPGLSRLYSERWSFDTVTYLANLAHVVWFAARFELLGPVGLAGILLLLTRGGASTADSAPRCAARSLLRLVAVYALVGARNPIFFERYFVPIGPLLTMTFVLEAEALRARLAAWPAPGRPPRVGAVVVGALALGLAVTVGVRHVELGGRVREIVAPLAGPVDFVVDDLRSRHPDPAGLVIATNYEAEPLMFYLGSRVVGRFHSARPEAIAAERAERPDVVIPRRSQARRLEAVQRYLLTGGYVPRTLPVADVPYNTIPELYAGRVLDRTHWFATPLPGPDAPALRLYERRSDAAVPADPEPDASAQEQILGDAPQAVRVTVVAAPQ